MHHIRDIISKRGEVGGQASASQLPTEPITSQIPAKHTRLPSNPLKKLVSLQVPTQPVASQPPPQSINYVPLPTELWMHILSYLNGRKDMHALTRTSRLLRILSLTFMWRTVDLSSEKRDELQSPIKLGVRNPLQSPYIAVIVTNLRVSLTSASHTCKGHFEGRLSCTCAKLDDLLGECLLSMTNLQVLLFTCRLSCSINTEPRHRYLEQLKTRNLRTFSFYCYCAPDSTVQCKDILTAPFSATIEALHWNAPANYIGLSVQHMQAVPSLRTLYYQGTPLDSHLLATRPIQRICITGVPLPNNELSQALENTPGKFTHFSISDISRLALLLPIKPSLFGNLQHVGTVPAYVSHLTDFVLTWPCLRQNVKVETLLSPFRSLKRLVSIDVVWVGNQARYAWDGILLTRVKAVLPKLVTVLCHRTPMSVIWEFNGDSWWRREVPSITAWDIISGVLDNEGGPVFSRLG